MMYGNSKYALGRRGPEQGGQGIPQEKPFWSQPPQEPQFNPQEDQQRARDQAPQGGPGMGAPAQPAPMPPQAPPMPQAAPQQAEEHAPQTRYNFGGRRPPMSRFMDGRN